MNDRTMEAQKEVRQQAEHIKSVAASSAGTSAAERIASAKALLDTGAITPQEFDQIKAKALTAP